MTSFAARCFGDPKWRRSEANALDPQLASEFPVSGDRSIAARRGRRPTGTAALERDDVTDDEALRAMLRRAEWRRSDANAVDPQLAPDSPISGDRSIAARGGRQERQCWSAT